jgi:hypothetical protein
MSNRILSYRGLLADGGQDTILLSTKKGEVGYRILKLEILTNLPGAGSDYESCVKVFKDPQSSVTGVVDFSNNRLLGVAFMSGDSASVTAVQETIIFDRELFNQDIYVTHNESVGSQGMNYYMELEVIKLSEDQAMVATLKDIRNNS